MRAFATLFTVYILFLAFMPCADAREKHSVFDVEQASEHQEHHEHEDCEDLCSPLCSCNCCSNGILFSVNFLYISPVLQSDQINFTSKAERDISLFSQNIWQPPKI